MPLRSDLVHLAASLPKGDPTRRKILAMLAGKPTIIDALGDAEKAFAKGDGPEALHHLGEALWGVAWMITDVVRDMPDLDPNEKRHAEKVLDAARHYQNYHR